MPESSPTLGADSTFTGKDLSPYWSDSIAALSSALWLPTGTGLARFGFDLIEWMAEQNGGEIVVLGNTDHSPEQELTEDILAILHTFSCRLHGLRRYRNAIQADTGLSDGGAAPDVETVV